MDEQSKHPGSENLKSWKPGESGNPAGKPKGTRNRSTIVRELLEAKAFKKFTDQQKELIGDDHDPKTLADQMAAALALRALQGDPAAFKELMDSSYGKLTDKVQTDHTFNQMGRVEATEGDGAPGQQLKRVTLDFQVGEPVPAPDEN